MRYKYLKYLAFVLGGLSTVIAAAALYLHASFDGVRLGAELSHFVKQRYQRVLKFDAPLTLSMFPRPLLRVPAASLSGRPGEGELGGFDEARIGLRLWPLLTGRVVVERVELAGLRLALQRGRDGKLNVADLLAPVASAGAPFEFDGARLALSGGSLTWQDELAGRSLALSELALDGAPLAAPADGQVALAGRLVQATPALDLRFEVAGAYRASELGQQLRNLHVGLKGVAGSQPALTLDAAVAELSLGSAAPPRLDGVSLLVRACLAEAPCELKASAPQLVLAADGLLAERLEASLRLDGGGQVSSQLSGLRASGGALRAERLSAELAWRSPAGRLSGTLASPASWQQGVLEVPALRGSLEVQPPQGAPLKLALEASGQADWERGSAAGRLLLQGAGSRLEGSWRLPRLAPLSLGFDLALDRLNLDALVAGRAKAGAEPARQDFGWLRGLAVDGVLRIGSLQAGGLHFERLRLPLTVADGRLLSKDHVASLYGGSVEGSLSLAADGNALAYRSYLQNANLAPLLDDALGRQAFRGLGKLFVDLHCVAATRADCVATLEGLARVRLNNGSVRGIDATAALREWRGLIQGRQAARRAHREAEETGIDEATASFQISRGVAHSTDLQARSGVLRISGAGDIDLGAGRLDLLSRTTLAALPARSDGGPLGVLRGLSVPIRVKGPWARPEWQLEPGTPVAAGAAVLEAGKAAVRTLVRALPARPPVLPLRPAAPAEP